MSYLCSFAISYCLGHLLVTSLLAKDKKLNVYLLFFLAAGLGLGLSGYILFYSFLVFDQLNKTAVILGHLLLLFGLLMLSSRTKPKHEKFLWEFRGLNLETNLFLLVIGIAFIPIICQAWLYPFGGWDAWSVWNLKARFLFLGEGNWKNLLDPILWRSSPHYPLLLPLINVWGWTFSSSPGSTGPLLTSLVFSALTAGLIFSGLIKSSKSLSFQNAFKIPPKILALLATLLMVTLPFFTKLASSQYCDIVLAYYLLGSFICLTQARTRSSKSFALLAGLFLGFLSFTKPEGASAALLIFFLSLPYLFRRDQTLKNQNLLAFFFLGLVIGGLPTILFELLYAPPNQTFINGLSSTIKPSSLFRMKMILSFFLVEFKSGKWNGIWFLCLSGLILSKGKCLRPTIRVIPVFLFCYFLMIGVYYYINTYFEIGWWLQVSLNRILFAILPCVVFWVFDSIEEDQ